MRAQTRWITQMAMLAALSVILVALIHFPILPAAPFLEYDPADIPIIIGTFLFGWVPGLLLTLVVCVVQGITVSAASGPIGIAMHFVATGTYVLTVGLIYGRAKSVRGAVIAMIAGTLAMCVMMVLWNLLLAPIYMGVPRSVVAGMLLPVFVPFNAIKAGVNSMLAYTAYRAALPYFKRFAGEMEKHQSGRVKA